MLGAASVALAKVNSTMSKDMLCFECRSSLHGAVRLAASLMQELLLGEGRQDIILPNTTLLEPNFAMSSEENILTDLQRR